MKSVILKTLLVGATFAFPMVMSTGCTREVAHSEKTEPGWFGGTKHEETTVYKNADGTTSVEREKKTVNP